MRPLVLLLLVHATTALAEPTVLRMATAAPEGTSWARELRALAREVERRTQGKVRMKWYFGGIAGDELQMGERMQRDQLDGVASGGMLCMRNSPSMRVFAIAGLLQNRAESRYVAGRLKSVLDDEFRARGFANLGEFTMGPTLPLTRSPVATLRDLQQVRLWVWNLDPVGLPTMQAAGLSVVALPLEEATHAFDEGRVDGFSTVPAAILAFQWSTQAHYLTNLPLNSTLGCALVANRAFDALSLEAQEILRSAGAQAAGHVEAIGERDDAALLGGLFARQGVKVTQPTAQLRAEFAEAAQAARERVGAAVVDPALLLRVTTWMADYRARRSR